MPAPASRGRAMSRLWANDEELAKKDDDLHAPRHARHGSQWQSAHIPRRSALARFAVYALIAFLIIMTFSRLLGSSPNVSIDQPLPDRGLSDEAPLPHFDPPKPLDVVKDIGGGAKAPKSKHEQDRTYSGPVKLPGLGNSLHQISGTNGKQVKNRNVLFAAASLTSAASLLPMACQMAKERQNYVHFAFMGRSNIPLKELLKVNGIDATDPNGICPIILHDARPDHVLTSTETRMMICTARAMYHINTYMHPQAIIIDSTADEEKYFLSGLRDQIRGLKSALIELPDRPGLRLSWITKLDSASLAAWDKATIDILVQAPSSGAGNLDRLLRSLSRVDLSGMSVPHLTVELPNKVEPQIQKLLSRFQWPPPHETGGNRPNMLSLRHRIPRTKLSEEESSVRFLESFWPRSPAYSNILVLSSHTEVTPQFLHYVKYSLLHHRYSNAAIIQEWGANLMGLSFAFPTTLLDNSQPLTLPPADDDAGSSFLWQAPNSDATLFPGDKWIELHGYASQVLERQHASLSLTPLLSHKEVSKKYPAWLEYVLQLSRLRGYYTVYPGQETTRALMGVHNDIPDVPEEYGEDEDARKGVEGDGLQDQATELFDSYWQVDMLQTLPRHGGLPYLTLLPLLSWDGAKTSLEEMSLDAEDFAVRFRIQVGNCAEDDAYRPASKLAGDLFCELSDGP